MIHSRVEQLNLNFSIMLHAIQFYIIKHNFQFDCWIWLKSYKGFLDILFNIFLKKIQVN